jgi:hypothetical protein
MIDLTRSSPTGPGWRSGLAIAAAALGALLIVVLMRLDTRVLVSWHGFLHTAIANRFPSPTIPPENPFFAGEPVAYYWAYHMLGAWLARWLDLDLVRVLSGLSALSLAVIVTAGGAIGRSRLGSTTAGLLTAYLAVAGLNPLGPLTALAKHLLRGVPLWVATPEVVETTFVSDDLADDLMTQPLLPALVLGADWRFATNLPWFLDHSSRAFSLALVMVLAFLLLAPRGGLARGLVTLVVSAAITAFSPLVGFGVQFGLLGARLVLPPAPGAPAGLRGRLWGTSSYWWAAAGVLAAVPTFLNLVGLETAAPHLTSLRRLAWVTPMLALNAVVLAPLAVVGVRRAPDRLRSGLAPMALTGIGLHALAALVPFPDTNEHNLVNAAQVLLAVPAGLGAVRLAWPRFRGRAVGPAAVFATFLPVTALTLLSFTGRAALPITFRGAELIRLPEAGPLARFYDWVRRDTPPDAVFIQDPDHPVKMSGNISELPAFTRRTLFTDQPNYLTTPNPDSPLRERLARRAAQGERLDSAEIHYLRRLDRPLYAVTYAADDPAALSAATESYGAAVFREGFVAAFRIDLDRLAHRSQPEGWSLVLSTSAGSMEPRDIAVTPDGTVYVAGRASPAAVGTPGSFQSRPHPGPPSDRRIAPSDAFVAKLDSTGQVEWLTFIGGPNHDRAYGVEVDPRGYVYVAGRAGAGFPVTPGAAQTEFQGGTAASFYGPQDGFVCKIQPDGRALVFCTYFGSPDEKIIRDLAVDPTGAIYVASGHVRGSYPVPVNAAFINPPIGGDDAVIAKLAPDGSRFLWAAHLGGTGKESNENSVRLDGAGIPYLLFTTTSADVATSPTAYDRAFGGAADVFVAKIDPATGRTVWGTYLGGSGNESTETHELAVDGDGHAYVAAATTSRDFPTTPGTFQTEHGGGFNDVFVAKLSPDGSALVASTLIGGRDRDRAEGVTVDARGAVYFTGTTASPDFPLTDPSVRVNGVQDALAVKLSPELDRVVFATVLGGTGADFGRAVAVSPHGRFWIGGETRSADFPTRHPTPLTAGRREGFLAGFRR